MQESGHVAGGAVTSGELVSVETQSAPRVLSQANFARWTPATGN